MGKNEHHDENEGQTPPSGAADDATDRGEQAQLNFFDTVIPPTMNTENSAPAVEDEAVAVRDETDHSEHGVDAVSASAPLPDTERQAAESEAAGVPHDAQSAAAAEESAASRERAAATDTQADACGEDAMAMEDAGATDTESVLLSESLGQRLRAARETRGLRIEDAAHQMRLPLATVQAIEADRYERIGEGIYLRSYLAKYLRLLDLPLVLAERVLNQRDEPPPLVTSGTISRPRYLFERYSSSALYLILTAVIIVPAVWLATRAGLENNLTQITPLDATDGNVTLPAAKFAPAPAQDAADAQRADSSRDEPPLVASLLPAIKHDASNEAAEKPVAVPAGQHVLRVTLAEPSWVEIVGADGEKLDYGLLPAGTTRSYHSAGTIDVRVGNANGATVEVDGKSQDIAAFRRANVAHFKLSAGETTLSHSGG